MNFGKKITLYCKLDIYNKKIQFKRIQSKIYAKIIYQTMADTEISITFLLTIC